MKNEEQLRKWDRKAMEEKLKGQIRTIVSMVNSFDPKSDAALMAVTIPNLLSFMYQELHQAELNWLTAQIERGKGMKHHWERCAEFADTKFQNAVNEDEAMEWEKAVTKDLGGVEALTDFLTPLIERKKEVEILLGREEGV